MNKFGLFIILGLVVFAAGYFVYLTVDNLPTTVQYVVNENTPSQEQIVGGDEDKHGCKASAGYSWCEVKQKCLRTWEEECASFDAQDQEEMIKLQIKAEIVEKHGPNAGNLTITVSNVEGDFAKGGASELGFGGGMWFGVKVADEWKLVWDGNGIITCSDLSAYPNFPNTLIPQCFDKATQELKAR